MFKKLFLLAILFFVVFSLSLRYNKNLISYSDRNQSLISSQVLSATDSVDSPQTAPVVFAALPSFDQNMKTSLKIEDARPEIIKQYLKKYNSPLEPHAQLIVDLSDQYDFDYRWMVAIAQQESNLCKHIPEDSHNCWGWGIYGDKVTKFDSYEEAIRRIAPQFVKIFLKGDHTREPMTVMKTYTPPSDGSWAKGVSTFFGHLE